VTKKIYAFIGASGTGKTTLVNILDIPELISHTTRLPRKGESEGSPYYFSTSRQMEGLEKVEEAEYAGNHYALSKREVDNKLEQFDKVCVIMEKDGIRQIKDYFKNDPSIEIVVIYIHSPIEDIISRLQRDRKTEEINQRLKHMIENNEMYIPSFADFVVVNKNNELNKALEQLCFIIYNF